MRKLIAESAWHHEGDINFFMDLVTKILRSEASDVLKFHLSLNIEEYASTDHPWYEIGKRICSAHGYDTRLLLQSKKPMNNHLQSINIIPSIEFEKYNKRNLI